MVFSYFCNMKKPREKEWDFIKNNLYSDINKLLLTNKDKDLDIEFCIRAIQGIKIAKEKFPYLLDFQIIYPPQSNLQQTSSQITSEYKSSIFSNNNTLRDLSSGFGIDDIFFARKLKKIYYHEKNQELVDIARENFRTLGLNNIEIINGDSTKDIKEYEYTDIIYIDPSRRDNNNNRVFLLKDCKPNILEILPSLFLKTQIIALKLSPMLDIKELIREINNIKEIHIISIKNECKELFLLLEKDYFEEIEYYCIDIDNYGNRSEFIFKNPIPNNDFPSRKNIESFRYLFEPNSSIMKSGAYHILNQYFDITKLSQKSHIFLSQNDVKDFPGRRFIIKDLLPYKNKLIKSLSNIYPKANISVRNFSETVIQIRKRTKIKEGGEDYIFFTTNNHEEKIIFFCRKK